MVDLVIKFTENSTDPSCYGKIHANLRTPYTQFSTLVIDSLTTNACFEVLNTDDYIIVNDTTIHLIDNYSSLNSETISTMINDLLSNNNIAISTYVDNTNRIVFTSDSSFVINACSYNLASVLGLFDQTFPITAIQKIIEVSNEVSNEDSNEVSSKYVLQCLSVGNFLSTPILYLLASIGDKVFYNNGGNKKILMRINNSYSANFPVIANNAEFSTYGLSNDFSDITFELVDANFKPVKLLAPMYLCGNITADVKAETINTSITVTPDMLNKNANEVPLE